MSRPQFTPKYDLDTDTAQPMLEWNRTQEEAGGGITMRVAVRNAGPVEVRARAASIRFDLPYDRDARALYIAYSGAHSASLLSRSGVRCVADGVVESWWVGARHGIGGGVVVGAIDYTRWVSSTRADAGSIAVRHWLEEAVIESGATLRLPAIWVGMSEGAPLAELESFASLVGKFHGFRSTKSPCGWGSWGQFSECIDESLVRETIHAIGCSPHFRDVIDVVQIDDGWAQQLDNARVCPTWRPNGRFASGIAPLAAQLAGASQRTGLWLLPFTVNEGAPIMDHHPEFLVHSADGQPLRVGGGASYVFDPTHTQAAAELTRIFTRISDWGIRYLKLDFLRSLLAADPLNAVDDLQTARSYAGGNTRPEAYRRGLELVREAFGDNTFVLGCSSPLGAGAGLLDAQRIGPDIEPKWIGQRAGIRDCTKAVAANWFWHGRAWINDPDYLMTGNSAHESRFWSAAVALSGGSSILSVDLLEMEPWREELLSFVTPPSGRAGRPIDLFSSLGEPAVWVLPCSMGLDSWFVLGLLNWKDNASEIRIPLKDLNIAGSAHVWDAWRRSYSLEHNQVRVKVEAHDARIVAVRCADDRPRVVGSDIHFTQGERELAGSRWENSTLWLDPAPAFRDGTLMVWSPPHLVPMVNWAPERHADGWLLSIPWRSGGESVSIPFDVIGKK